MHNITSIASRDTAMDLAPSKAVFTQSRNPHSDARDVDIWRNFLLCFVVHA